MTESREFTLCGGTFLVLLLQARKQRIAARKNADGDSDGLSDRELFEGLIQVAFPDFTSPAGRSMKTYTSSYKSCKLSANEYLPFEKAEMLEMFDHAVKTNYQQPLMRMHDFILHFIDDKNMGSWLVRALLEVIESDSSIEEELFYIENKQPYDKKHLLAVDEVSLPAFLLGIWHFIVMNRKDNKVGELTFKSWHKEPASPRAKKEFSSDIGKNWMKPVNVTISSIDQDVLTEKLDEYGGDVPEGMDAILLEEEIAPELTEKAPCLLIPKGILPDDGEFSEYLENTREKYDKMKTLLYNDAPKKFYDFYVCNNISQKVPVKKYTYRTKIICDATADTLKECSNFILISGTGGLGKSMMMRHLLLDTIDSYSDGGQLPLFIPLKDYSDSYAGVLDYVYEKFDSLGGGRDDSEFEELLIEGRFLLLLDGLDEIKSDYRKKFEHDLEIFADKYTKNMFVISSRPTGSFISFHRFTVLDLCPFTKEQAIDLIDKLDFRPDEPVIKAHFKEELEKTLFVSHREFTENPLLLTIMLMTYEQFAEIPSKMHIFYREAYTALSQKHDASKGAFKRVLNTGLTADKFGDYFAEFCARTYRDEKFEFTEDMFDKYFNSLHEKRKGSPGITASDFRSDLVDNMCLMFYESGKYHFTHRSFQEYFCALYFSNQKDRTLGKIGEFFENKSTRHITDKTFSMLYDMIPDKIDEYIFEPFLTEMLEECEAGQGYWTFLQKMYPILYYEKGDTGTCNFNEPESFLYDFIIHKENIYASLENDDFPEEEEFVTNEWVYLDENYHDQDIDPDSLMELEEVPREYLYEFGKPDIVGRNYEIEISSLLRSPQYYEGLIEHMEGETFPLMVEYNEIRAYLEVLKEKRSALGDDLFDLFQ